MKSDNPEEYFSFDKYSEEDPITESVENYTKYLSDDKSETTVIEEIPSNGQGKGVGYYSRHLLDWVIKTVKNITWKGWLQIGLVILLIIIFILLLLFLPWPEWLGAFLNWVDALGVWGPILVAEMYVFCTICFVPGSILTLGAGFIFQSVWVGTITISIGSTIGCICAFLLGNTILRGWIERKIKPYEVFSALDTAIAMKGWLVVLLLRLSPVVPFNLLNYALGLTKVGVIEYSLCSWIGMLPATVVYVYIGTTLGGIAQIVSGNVSANPLTTTLFVIGLLATFVVVVIISYFAKVQIQQVLRKAKMKNEEDQKNANKPTKNVEEI